MRWSDILPEETLALGDALTQKTLDERAAGQKICPAQENIFRALSVTTPDRLKVCIVGQDPYHTPGQANGLAFSVAPGAPLQPSLENIFQELMTDVRCPRPSTGDLTPWAERGVLLLNTSLTVYEHRPNSHAAWGWQDFTKSVFLTALTMPQPVVFLLWGGNARRFLADVDFSGYRNKFALVSSHPSPFSAYSGSRTAQAFMGSRPFSRANALLSGAGAEPVDWALP